MYISNTRFSHSHSGNRKLYPSVFVFSMPPTKMQPSFENVETREMS